MSIVMVELYSLIALNFSLGSSVLFSDYTMNGIFYGAVLFIMLKFFKSKTVCFTGRRSQKLPWRINEEDRRCKAMKITLRSEIEKTIKQGYNIFLCGRAIGFDMICAETVIELKKNNPI